MNYTKKDWRVEPENTYSQDFRIYIDNNGVQGDIARVYLHNGEQEANAHLISAAPKMEQALRALLEGQEIEKGRVVCRACPSEKAILQGFEALAKAEGNVERHV